MKEENKRVPIAARDDDSLMMKAISFLRDKKVRILEISSIKITATVEGFHSNNPNDPDAINTAKEPYTIIIRRNGEHVCSCQAILYTRRKKPPYHQFWGKDPTKVIRIAPECSHVLAIKLTNQYKQWILEPDVIEKWRTIAPDSAINDPVMEAKKEIKELANRIPSIKSFVRTSGLKVVPVEPLNVDDLTNPRARKKVDLIGSLEEHTN